MEAAKEVATDVAQKVATEEAKKQWYVIHTYSGYENKVKTTLEQKVHAMGLEEDISLIVVPLADEIEEKDGVKKVVKRKIYPGYVFVEMKVTKDMSSPSKPWEVPSESWYIVRNTPGVTGFLGTATKPVPLSDSEAAAMLKSQGLDQDAQEETAEPVQILDVEVGETVRITSGPMENRFGVITEIDHERGLLKLHMEMFSRDDTLVEVEYSQIEKIL